MQVFIDIQICTYVNACLIFQTRYINTFSLDSKLDKNSYSCTFIFWAQRDLFRLLCPSVSYKSWLWSPVTPRSNCFSVICYIQGEWLIQNAD